MTLKEYAVDEFKRSPITLLLTGVSVIVAVAGVFLAWLQYSGASPILPSGTVSTLQTNRLNLSNLGLAISFFLAVTFIFASLTRMLAKVHGFAALLLSVPSAVLSSFSTLVVLYFAPVRMMTPEAHASLLDIVFYGTAIGFIAINGRPVLIGVLDTPRKKDESGNEISKDSLDGVALIFASIIFVSIWGSAVSSGLTRMVKTFLA
jgi:hypothetical protein